MKVDELMVGDWVLFCGSEYHIISADFAANYEFEPIPLTKEIMEKNGFEYFSGGGCIIKELSDDEIPTLYVWDIITDSLCIVDYYSTNKYTYIKECKYVHEFQHELRSCGIEKEIVL